MNCDSILTIPVLGGMNHIRENQVEPERDDAKREVAPWHGHTTGHYFNYHEYCIQGMEADIVPSYRADQSDSTQPRGRYEQSSGVAKEPASERIAQ